MTFEEWYEKWTGSKVKCENYDVRGAWQHQQAKIDHILNMISTRTENEINGSEYDTLVYLVKDIQELLK